VDGIGEAAPPADGAVVGDGGLADPVHALPGDVAVLGDDQAEGPVAGLLVVVGEKGVAHGAVGVGLRGGHRRQDEAVVEVKVAGGEGR
jgi:hypothetical protein